MKNARYYNHSDQTYQSIPIVIDKGEGNITVQV